MNAPITSPAFRKSNASQTNKSFISGVPEIVNYAEFLAREYLPALSEAIMEAVEMEQGLLKERAYNSPDNWSALYEDMSVSFNPETSEFVYGVPGNTENALKATDLEYGVPSQNAPNPLVRSFVKEREQDLGKDIANAVSRRLNGRYR